MNTQYNDPKGAAGALKTPLGLIPPYAMEQTAWAHKLGAEKYGPFNWRDTGVCATTYVNAIMRHLNAWRDGEDLDQESGISHLAHVACSCNILLDADYCNTLQDDRNTTPNNELTKITVGLLNKWAVKAPKPEPEYYYLGSEDVIEKGDEYYDSFEDVWVASTYIGRPAGKLITSVPYRRPIKLENIFEETDEHDQCECGRLLVNHFLMGAICEDCDLQWQDPY